MEAYRSTDLLNVDMRDIPKVIDSITSEEIETVKRTSKDLEVVSSHELRSVIAVRKLKELPKRKIKFALSTGILITIINALLFNGIEYFLQKDIFTTIEIISSIFAQMLVNNMFAFTAFNRNADYEHRNDIKKYHEECSLKVKETKERLKTSYTSLLKALQKLKEELLEIKENSNYLEDNNSIDLAIKEIENKISFTETKMKLELK